MDHIRSNKSPSEPLVLERRREIEQVPEESVRHAGNLFFVNNLMHITSLSYDIGTKNVSKHQKQTHCCHCHEMRGDFLNNAKSGNDLVDF